MITCAIIGVTGLVGTTFLKVLEEQKLKIDKYELFASSKSKGKVVTFMGETYEIQELTHDVPPKGFTYALFSVGAKISVEYAKEFVKNGTTVIDNSSAFRMDKDVPLIVPEINMKAAYHSKLIANPNCSTIQAVAVLYPLYLKYGINRIIYSTYQAVSGAGQRGIEDLINSQKGLPPQKFLYPINNNCLPQIDDFLDNGYTKEEMKMINETKKILNDDTINITATCVRVPVLNSHSESINIELKNSFDILDIKQLLSCSESIIVLDNPALSIYPINTFATGKDEILVGRIRRDYSNSNSINIWVVSDNIRKGAATNAVQILSELIKVNTNC